MNLQITINTLIKVMTLPPFELIYAATKTGGIGYKGSMPWNLPEDMKHFRRLTSETEDLPNIVIMGSKTFKSLKKPLPNRINLVLSRTLKESFVFGSVELLLEHIKAISGTYNKIFVIGGSQIYGLLLPYVETIHQTLIYQDFECDTIWHIPEGFKLLHSDKRDDLELNTLQRAV